ncbi:MAG: efflux RND transporter permease subunit, partial [Gammaproteobacteria bacterium]
LAALVPRPRLHLIRFHGVLAPNAKVRPAIIPSASSDANPAAPDQAESPHSSPLARMKRLTLILMTALAAGLALVPLTLRGGEPGSEIQTPMAIVILFGLLSSTALNMIVVPALYLRFGSALRVKEQRSAVRTVTA